MDPVWGYEAINVEAQQTDPSSLLNWMRNMIALRKLFRVFGRGSIEFLNPENRKVLAYLRRYGDEQVLCVANLSRFAQPVDLDLSDLDGTIPVEMLGYVEFPPIQRQPYRLTLAPYGFLWLELHQPEVPEIFAGETEQSPLGVTDGWESFLEGTQAHRLETQLFPEYLPKQPWFGGKSRRIKTTRIADFAALETPHSGLVLVEVQYESGPPETYLLSLAITFGDSADELRREAPNGVVSSIISREGPGALHNGVLNDNTCVEILSLIENAREIRTRHGLIRGERGTAFAALRGSTEVRLPVRRTSVEQRNTSILYGDRFILKLFRRQQAGPNPDCEIGKYLTEKVHFDRILPFAGSIEYLPADAESSTLAMLQGLVANEGDGWKWTIEELERYYENCATVTFPEDLAGELLNPRELSERALPNLARDHVGIYLDSAATLGRRTAELHLALASPSDDPAFAPEPLRADDLQSLLADLRQQASGVFDVLKGNMARLPDEVVEMAALVLSRRRQILDPFRALAGNGLHAQRTRIHGDYRLGQVLRAKTDYVILDFEGEPARSLADRRFKRSPLKDVAGMLRSLSYAAHGTLMNYTARRPEDLTRLEPWAQLWEQATSAEFLRAYRETAQGAEFLPADGGDCRTLLDAYLLDKALCELLSELNNRPSWVRIPLMGILSLSL